MRCNENYKVIISDAKLKTNVRMFVSGYKLYREIKMASSLPLHHCVSSVSVKTQIEKEWLYGMPYNYLNESNVNKTQKYT